MGGGGGEGDGEGWRWGGTLRGAPYLQNNQPNAVKWQGGEDDEQKGRAGAGAAFVVGHRKSRLDDNTCGDGWQDSRFEKGQVFGLTIG